jgi:diguanylate cyclase (GGDEF)-like protein
MSFTAPAGPQYDPLTGVYSRQMLRQWLPEGLDHAQRDQSSLALMMLDIDYFKSINDAFGHSRGDQTLADFAQRLKSLLRASDLVFRYGGDEFVILSPHTTVSQARELASRLIQAIQASSFGSNPELSVSVSLGIAIYPDDGLTPEAIFEAADQRHYFAKRNGRGQAVSESPPQSKPALFIEPSRFIEQDEALGKLHQFLELLPTQGRGAMRISGPGGAGHSRFLAEALKIARLRGYAILLLKGQAAQKHRLFSVLLEALQNNPLTPPSHALPTLVSSKSGEHFIASLRNSVAEKGNVGLLVTVDDIPQIDRGSLGFLHDLYFYPDLPRLGLIFTDGGVSNHLGFPWDISNAENANLRPLSREGVKVWVRQAMQWEAPRSFLEWLFKQTGGLPGALMLGMTVLTQQGLLQPGLEGWVISGDYTEIHIEELLERRVEGFPVNIPGGLTDFVGRENEIRQLKQLFRENRLINLHGAGGMGKTRLALQAAAECADQFTDGTGYVPLGGVKTAEWLVSAIADALHYTFFGPREPDELLLTYLRDKEMLLVLDNFEHLLTGAEVISEILDQAPGIHLIITSCERLNLPGETLFHLAGLPVPKSGQEADLESYASVQLFIHSARRYQPEFNPAAEDWPAIAQICRMVEGMPLGIEMAASWIQSYRPPTIATEINSSLTGMTNGTIVPEQYHRLKATFDSLWDNLSSSEQDSLYRLSVLPAEFGSEAARQIADASVFFLEALVNRSILHRNPRGRYQMHELLRQYAAEKMEQLPSVHSEAIQSFCRFYLSLVESQQEKLPHDGQALELLKYEGDNLRSAWYQAITHHLSQWIDRAALPLSQYYRLANLWREGELAFDAAVQWAKSHLQNGTFQDSQATLGKLLVAQAGLLNDRASYARAAECAQEALELTQICGNNSLQAAAHLELGHTLWRQIDFNQARQHLTNALELARTNHLLQIEIDTLRGLGMLSLSETNYAEALTNLSQSLDLCRQYGNQRSESAALNAMGTIYLISGSTQKALDYYQEAQQLLNSLGDQLAEGRLVNNLGCVHQSEGDNYLAMTCFEQALSIDQKVGDRAAISAALTNLGIAYHRLGELERASATYEHAIQVCAEIGQWAGGAGVLSNLGLLYYHQGNYKAASQYQLQAARVAQEHNETLLHSYPLARLGQISLALKRYAEADQYCQEAIQYRIANNRADLTLDPLACLARLSLAQDDLPQALNYCEKLLAQCQLVISDDDTDDPFWIYLTLYKVFQAAKDERAGQYLRTAYTELRKRANAIPDLEIRISYLENLPSIRLVNQICLDNYT